MNGTEGDAIFEDDDNNLVLDTDDIHTDVPLKAILKNCIKIFLMI